MKVKIKRLDSQVPLPSYIYQGEDAGLDLCSREEGELATGEFGLFGTGIMIAIPRGFAGFIHPRSGLALKFGVTVLNAGGVVDPGYRGEVGVILINHGPKPFQVKKGDRIAQLIIKSTPPILWEEVENLPKTKRDKGGFGHTGYRGE